MRQRELGLYTKALLATACIVFGGASSALAVTSQSQNFELTEPEFGAGAALETCSGQYCAQASIGGTSVGESSNEKTTATFGEVAASDDPLLEVIIEEGESNLGVLTTEQPATKTTLIKIKTYLTDGYTLQIVGDTPTYEEYGLKTLTVPTASEPGTEQFGINIVANTTPNIGADIKQVPSDGISFGYGTNDYIQTNLFKYASGDVVARSDSASGQTEYTVSMIVNVANSTPAGHFTGDFAAVVIPAF